MCPGWVSAEAPPATLKLLLMSHDYADLRMPAVQSQQCSGPTHAAQDLLHGSAK